MRSGRVVEWSRRSQNPHPCKSGKAAAPGDIVVLSPVRDSMRWPEPRAKRLKVVTHSLPPALFMGLIVGFPAGLGVWLFYRLVRFAIQGYPSASRSHSVAIGLRPTPRPPCRAEK